MRKNDLTAKGAPYHLPELRGKQRNARKEILIRQDSQDCQDVINFCLNLCVRLCESAAETKIF